jgi:hypothetical protein
VNELQNLIPLAVGMMISPLPIVAIVAIVLAPRGRAAAPIYTTTFTIVSLVFLALGAVFSANSSSSSASGSSSTISFVFAIIITIGFALFAVLSWIGRPKPGQTAKAPSWLAAIDNVTPLSAAGLGFVMAITNTKNIPLALKGGALIGDAHSSLPITILLCVVVAIVGSLALIVPALIALSTSDRVIGALQRVKTEMIAHNAVMMTVLFAILAANEAAQVVHHLVS